MDDLVLQDTKNQAWKDDKSRFGFKMLQKMGWKEDKGLGKNDSGSVASIKVSKREEGLGLGMEKVTDNAGALGWNSTAKSFNEVLKLLNESYGKPTKVKKSKKSKIPILSAGMKYKKHSAAKDLSTKSAAELKSIFGHSMVTSTVETNDDNGNSSSETVEAEVEVKKVSKSKRRKEEEEEDASSVEDVPQKKSKKKKREAVEAVEEEEEEEETVTKKDKKKKKKPQ